MDAAALHELQTALGYQFSDLSLLDLALRHASSSPTRAESNERMEFLGDAVLGLIVCNRIYCRFDDQLEGEMTKIKSQTVSRETCARLARQLQLHEHLTIGKGMMTGAQRPSSLDAAVFESVVGAIYLDGGYEAAERFIVPLIDPLIESSAASGHQQNFKSVLQQYAQQNLGGLPSYRVLDEKGPDHTKAFKISVEIGGRRFDPVWGQSKKKAEQAAALLALRELGVAEDLANGEVRISGRNGTGK